jgi:Cu/Ag efflux pump CusA
VSIDTAADYDATVASIKRVASAYPGMRSEVLSYSQARMREVLGRTGDEVTVRIFGDDLDVLHEKADEARDLLTNIDGVDDARVTSRAAEPTMEVEVDLARAREAGIKPGDVRRAAATLLSGLRVGSLFERQKVFDVVVWANPESRRSLSSVQDLMIDTPVGGRVRLGDVADVRVRPTPPVIEHQDISRFVDVTANVSGRSPGAVESELRSRLQTVDFPLEYHAEMLTDFDEQQGAQTRLVGVVIAALIGMLLLFQAAFSSWRLAFVAFLMLPVALAGGVIAAKVDGGPMTLATVAGLLGVLAFAVRTTVALFDRLQRLRLDDGLELDAALVVRAASERALPTVVTVVGVTAMLVPALIMGNGAGLELIAPMTIVMIGGMVSTAAMALFVLPALYLRLAPERLTAPLDFDDADTDELDLTRLQDSVASPNGDVVAVGAAPTNGEGATGAPVASIEETDG